MLARYIAASLSYGAFHSVRQLWNKESEYSTRPGSKRGQMLLADKLVHAAIITGTSFMYWPLFLHYDLNCRQLVVRRPPGIGIKTCPPRVRARASG